MTRSELSEVVREAAKKLQEWDVARGEEVIIISRVAFEDIRQHEDTISGRLVLERQSTPDERWMASIPELGIQFNLLISPTLEEIIKEANEIRTR
jgi:hypothetical protein